MLRIITWSATDRNIQPGRMPEITVATFPAPVDKSEFFQFVDQIPDFRRHYKMVLKRYYKSSDLVEHQCM